MRHPNPHPLRRGLLAATATAAIAIAASVGFHLGGTAMAHTGSPEDRRYTRGLEALKAVGGPDYDRALRALDPLAPDMSRLTIEGPYGDVMSRPGLDLKSRELVNVAPTPARP